MRISKLLPLALTAMLLATGACGPVAENGPTEPDSATVDEEPAEPDSATEEMAEAPTADPYDLGGREVLIGTDPTYEPFETENDVGQIVGIDPDLMAAICQIVNCQPRFQGTAWDGIFAALAAGEFDALMSAITILPEREENSNATFTDPYYSIGQVILVRADDETISGVEDLPEAVVGVQVGTTGDTAASDAGVPEDSLRRFDNMPLAVQALLGGDVDAVVLDSTPAAKAVETADEGSLRIVGEPFTSEDYGILVPNDSPELLTAFNYAIAELRASGELDRIIAEWTEAEEAEDAAEMPEGSGEADDASEGDGMSDSDEGGTGDEGDDSAGDEGEDSAGDAGAGAGDEASDEG